MKVNSARNLLLALALMLIGSSLFAETKTVTMGIYSWEPFVSEKQANHGLFAEIIVAALNKTGYTVSVKNYPFARIIYSLETGDIDISPAISQNDERKKFIDFTDPIYELDMGFTFKNGHLNFQTMADLRSYTGGIMRGTFWAAELNAAGIRYEEVADQEQNIRKLAANRIDFVCMPREIAFTLLKTLGEDQSRYDFRLFRKEAQLAGISKKTKFAGLHGDFQQGLSLIKRDGTYDKIVSRYK